MLAEHPRRQAALVSNTNAAEDGGVSVIYFINVPLRNSCKVCWISSRVFITKGP